jgi:dihydroorotate dehydrogenase electron transfer subunit
MALRTHGTSMTLFYGARSATELFYADWFERPDLRVVFCTEDGTRGERGRVTMPLERELQQAKGRDIVIYACGPEPMLEATAALAHRYHVPSQVSVERVMGCGMGGCYSCVIPVRAGAGRQHYVRSCLSGPVFAGADIVWD